jgi:two-component system, OmpR family, phosphate regulon response regulator OmpR
MTDQQPHILVVDDDTRLRELLRDYLMKNDYRVTVAEDADDARRYMVSLQYDLLILDVMMPGETGLELAKSIRRSSDVPILMLTAMGEADDRISGLEHGADDYLAKPFEPRELLLRLQSLLRRAAPRTPLAPVEPLNFGDFRFDVVRGEMTKDGDVVHLTSSEVSVLRLFANRIGVTISRLEISENGGGGSERAVDVQIARLRRKIEPDARTPRYLQTIWGEGYVLWTD